MSENLLAPGAGGLVAPSPQDQVANPLQPPMPGPSPMMQHFGDLQDQAAARFGKIEGVAKMTAATRQGLEHCLALGDTVTTEDVVEAAAGMVAAGVPAMEVASTLADMPTGGEALQAWLAQQSEVLAGQEAQVAAGLANAGFDLGVAGLHHLLAYSAESAALRHAAPTGIN